MGLYPDTALGVMTGPDLARPQRVHPEVTQVQPLCALPAGDRPDCLADPVTGAGASHHTLSQLSATKVDRSKYKVCFPNTLN